MNNKSTKKKNVNTKTKTAKPASVAAGTQVKPNIITKYGTKNFILMVTALVLALILIVYAVGAVIVAIQNNKNDNFDYVTSDLSEYISIEEESYKHYKVSLQIAKPKDIEVEVQILNLIASKKGAVLGEGAKYHAGNISAGDVIDIYYRGYIKDKDGNENAVDGMCNFGSTSPSALEIGSGSFVSGFELNLVGKDFNKNNRLIKITDGKPLDGQILYISYVKQLKGSEGNTNKTTVSATAPERVVLGTDNIDEKYGAGFEEKLRSLTIGAGTGAAFETDIGGKTYNYTDLKIGFATDCEREGNYILVECYFPYDYNNETLANKTAYFEVYVHGVVEYDVPEFNDEFVLENLEDEDFGITKEDLDEYEGSYTEKLKAYYKKTIDENYEAEYESALTSAMWNHYLGDGVVKIKKYPEKKVNKIYKEYYNEVETQYNKNNGVYTSSYGTTTTCKSLDEYAKKYCGLDYSNTDWRDYLLAQAKNIVKERLVLYYIMRAENLMPEEAVLNEKIAEAKKEHLDEFVKQYIEEYNVDKSKYTEEKWAEFLADREKELFVYYGAEYFAEKVYYEIALDEFLKWPTVTTMDDVETSDK